VNASYTDALNNKVETSFTAKSSYFAFDYAYIRPDIAGKGSYQHTSTSAVFKFTDKNSEQGWVYPASVDMSGYKYLVIRLTQKQTANAYLNIYTTDKTTGPCCSTGSFGNETELVFPLSDLKYTAPKANEGKPLNLKQIRMVTFKTGLASKNLNVKEMFLSNDDRFTPSGIIDMEYTGEPGTEKVYDLQGRRVSTSPSQTSNLRKGLYIINGKKVIRH
jgi:hypothetical protein